MRSAPQAAVAPQQAQPLAQAGPQSMELDPSMQSPFAAAQPEAPPADAASEPAEPAGGSELPGDAGPAGAGGMERSGSLRRDRASAFGHAPEGARQRARSGELPSAFSGAEAEQLPSDSAAAGGAPVGRQESSSGPAGAGGAGLPPLPPGQQLRRTASQAALDTSSPQSEEERLLARRAVVAAELQGIDQELAQLRLRDRAGEQQQPKTTGSGARRAPAVPGGQGSAALPSLHDLGMHAGGANCAPPDSATAAQLCTHPGQHRLAFLPSPLQRRRRPRCARGAKTKKLRGLLNAGAAGQCRLCH